MLKFFFVFRHFRVFRLAADPYVPPTHTESAATSEKPAAEQPSEKITGIDPESWPLVALAIAASVVLATDIRYALSHWAGLTRFLDDGRLELDTNPVENTIRPVVLTRKNALFAGHEVGAENWAGG